MDPRWLLWHWQGELVMVEQQLLEEHEQDIQAGQRVPTWAQSPLQTLNHPCGPARAAPRLSQQRVCRFAAVLPELCLCCALGCHEDDPPSYRP